jgi:hypothetical protein
MLHVHYVCDNDETSVVVAVADDDGADLNVDVDSCDDNFDNKRIVSMREMFCY